jgi:8-oxo-dGTP pyrophosphatase MutT (NUDIX family)
MKHVSRAIIVNDQGKVLLGRRVRPLGAGQYALVGGKPKKGETAESAIVREVKEELGIDFYPTSCIENEDSVSDPLSPWSVTTFTGTYTGEFNVNSADISDVIWVSDSDLDTIDIAFDHRDRLRDYFRSRR